MAKKRTSSPTSTKKSAGKLKKRSEERFVTSAAFMPLPAAIIGMLGCAVLGVGAFGLWVMEPPESWSSYAVAVGGFGLGTALWFGQARENAILVGDAGVAIETDRQTLRAPWFALKRISVSGAQVELSLEGSRITFTLGANRAALARILEQAALRVPQALDVDTDIVQRLPSSAELQGQRCNIDTDQVTGRHCAASKKVITLEEEARLCPRCGQLYHQQGLPERCKSCDEKLGENLLLA